LSYAPTVGSFRQDETKIITVFHPLSRSAVRSRTRAFPHSPSEMTKVKSA